MKQINLSEDFRKFAGISSLQMNRLQKHYSKPSMMTPNIIEERPLNVASLDVFSRLMMDRIIFLGMPIDAQIANIVMAQLLYLENVSSTEDIKIYLNTPGGEIYSGNQMLDTMALIRPDVQTIVCGMAASFGFMIAISGTKGKRAALKHSRLLCHQPLGSASGQASDILITARQIELLKKELCETISEKTGQPYDKVVTDCDRDNYMTSDEALAYGAIDKILTKPTEPTK